MAQRRPAEAPPVLAQPVLLPAQPWRFRRIRQRRRRCRLRPRPTRREAERRGVPAARSARAGHARRWHLARAEAVTSIRPTMTRGPGPSAQEGVSGPGRAARRRSRGPERTPRWRSAGPPLGSAFLPRQAQPVCASPPLPAASLLLPVRSATSLNRRARAEAAAECCRLLSFGRSPGCRDRVILAGQGRHLPGRWASTDLVAESLVIRPSRRSHQIGESATRPADRQ